VIRFRMYSIGIVCLATVLVLGPRACAIQSYHVGNSLTNDTMGNHIDGVLGIQSVAELGGHDLDIGYHIDSSQALHTIWADPNEVDLTFGDFGKFDEALPTNNWDYVTLQPHLSFGSTQGLDLIHLNNFIGLTESNPSYDGTNFFVLQTWPRASQWPYVDFWESESIDAPSTSTLMKRQYFDNLMPQVKASNPGTSVWMIPTGEVLYELHQQFNAGTLPDVNSNLDFFRPSGSGVDNGIHMSLTIGRYIAATTAYATMFREDVRGQEAPDIFLSEEPTLTPALVDAINETIWDVITRNPWTGLSDFNDDSAINGLDLTNWEAAYGTNDTGDSNGDGVSSGGDFLRWQQSYTGPPLLSADFDEDSLVNSSDLSIWENSFGVNGAADANFDGDSDGGDFLIWQQQLTDAAPPFASVTQVPEPAAWLLFVMSVAFASTRRVGRSQLKLRPTSQVGVLRDHFVS